MSKDRTRPVRRRVAGVVVAVALLTIAIGAVSCTSNYPPIVESLRSQGDCVAASADCRLEVVARDRNGDELSYFWSATGGSFNGSGPQVTWIAPRDPGPHTVRVTVRDARGATTAAELSIGANRPPVIDEVRRAASGVRQDGTVPLEVDAWDPDGDALAYHWSATAGSFNGSGGRVTWMAPPEAPACCAVAGPHSVNVTVCDTHGAAAVAGLTIGADRPPVINGIRPAASVVTEGDTLALEVDAQDPDGGSLAYEWSATVGVITPGGERVEWQAPEGGGISRITVAVTDETGAKAVDSVSLQVNRRPVITRLAVNRATGQCTVHPNETAMLEVVASDPEGDELTYGWSTSGGSIVREGPNVLWITPESPGQHTVTVTVVDQWGGQDRASAKVQVREGG